MSALKLIISLIGVFLNVYAVASSAIPDVVLVNSKREFIANVRLDLSRGIRNRRIRIPERLVRDVPHFIDNASKHWASSVWSFHKRYDLIEHIASVSGVFVQVNDDMTEITDILVKLYYFSYTPLHDARTEASDALFSDEIYSLSELKPFRLREARKYSEDSPYFYLGHLPVHILGFDSEHNAAYVVRESDLETLTGNIEVRRLPVTALSFYSNSRTSLRMRRMAEDYRLVNEKFLRIPTKPQLVTATATYENRYAAGGAIWQELVAKGIIDLWDCSTELARAEFMPQSPVFISTGP